MFTSLHDFQPDMTQANLIWIDDWHVEGHHLRSFRLTTAHLYGAPVRTYGIFGVPATGQSSGKFPGILHIHGGGQTASLENVLFNLRAGYACLSFDWTGLKEGRNPQTVTEYPVEIEDIGNSFQALTTKQPQDTTVCLAFQAAVTCLHMLAEQPEVDRERVGIYGISWGGFLTWLVNGTQTLQRCAIAIYGTGGMNRPNHIRHHHWNAATDQQRLAWGRLFEPLRYACTQKAPIYHINGTDDFFGGFDIAAELLSLTPTEYRCDYTPNCNHHFDTGSTLTARQWMDHYLKDGPAVPSAPDVAITILDDSRVRITVRSSNADQNHLTLHYSCGKVWHGARCWYSATNWDREDTTYVMDLPVNGQLWCTVQQLDPQTGATVSSLPLIVDMPKAASTYDPLLYQPGIRETGWGMQWRTELFDAGFEDLPWAFTGAGMEIGPKPTGSLLFMGLSAPEHQPPSGTALVLELHGEGSLELQLEPRNPAYRGTPYITTIEPCNHEISLKPGDFVTAAGKPLSSWTDVALLAIVRHEQENGATCTLRRMFWQHD